MSSHKWTPLDIEGNEDVLGEREAHSAALVQVGSTAASPEQNTTGGLAVVVIGGYVDGSHSPQPIALSLNPLLDPLKDGVDGSSGLRWAPIGDEDAIYERESCVLVSTYTESQQGSLVASPFSVFMFGGMNSDYDYLNDLHHLRVVECPSGPNGLALERSELTAMQSGEIPSPRCKHLGLFLPTCNSIAVFGGEATRAVGGEDGGDDTIEYVSDELFLLDVQTLLWRRVECSMAGDHFGSRLARYLTAAAVLPTSPASFLLYGGAYHNHHEGISMDSNNDVWLCSLQKRKANVDNTDLNKESGEFLGQWTLISRPQENILPRCNGHTGFAGATSSPSNRRAIFAGGKDRHRGFDGVVSVMSNGTDGAWAFEKDADPLSGAVLQKKQQLRSNGGKEGTVAGAEDEGGDEDDDDDGIEDEDYFGCGYPHWRYTGASVQLPSTSSLALRGLVIGGQCRHNDPVGTYLLEAWSSK